LVADEYGMGGAAGARAVPTISTEPGVASPADGCRCGEMGAVFPAGRGAWVFGLVKVGLSVVCDSGFAAAGGVARAEAASAGSVEREFAGGSSGGSAAARVKRGEGNRQANGESASTAGYSWSRRASAGGNPKVDARGQSGCGDEGGAGDGSLWWFRTRFRGRLVPVVPKAREETARSRRPSDGFTRGSEGAAASSADGKARPGCNRSFSPSFGRLHSRLRKRGRFGRGSEGAGPVVTARSRRPSDGFTRGSEGGVRSRRSGGGRVRIRVKMGD
jgi:hypothetical protein